LEGAYQEEQNTFVPLVGATFDIFSIPFLVLKTNSDSTFHFLAGNQSLSVRSSFFNGNVQKDTLLSSLCSSQVYLQIEERIRKAYKSRKLINFVLNFENQPDRQSSNNIIVWPFAKNEKVFIDLVGVLETQPYLPCEILQRNFFQELIAVYQDRVHYGDLFFDVWRTAGEVKYPGFISHARRTAELALLLGSEMGLSEQELRSLWEGAQLHDIGKLAIPDYILLKPGRLSRAEWKIIKEHTFIAQTILEGFPIAQESMDVIYYHHEQWDGQGYLEGLSGKSIPLFARIFSVVDVWDALLSDRPYRRAYKVSDARSYLMEQGCKKFDPEILDCFLKLVDTELVRILYDGSCSGWRCDTRLL
jgi:HD-GYP domain-containing protein (c-di-GMP phosphodiesterase class II)